MLLWPEAWSARLAKRCALGSFGEGPGSGNLKVQLRRCWIMSTLEREGRWRDKNGPKWPASAREKGNRGREDRYGPKWPAPLGYVGCVTGTDPNGRLLSGGRGVEGQKRTKRAGSCQGKRDGSGKTGTDLNGRHLLCFTFIDFQAT